MFKYQLDCEQAMNTLLAYLRDEEPVFTRKDVFDAFEGCEGDLQAHFRKALRNNNCSDIHELLDAACACDMLIEYEGTYVAIDWTDSLEQMIPKKQKHAWLKPVYEYLGIEYTVVCKATRYHHVKTKTHEMIARVKASGAVLDHIKSMIEKGKTNSTLEIVIQTKL